MFEPMTDVDRPAEIDVLTGGHCVVLVVDPETAETIARSHELAAHMSLFDESTRPQWRDEVDRIMTAAASARHTHPRTADEILANAVPLRAVKR